jgi:hypothetical protein
MPQKFILSSPMLMGKAESGFPPHNRLLPPTLNRQAASLGFSATLQKGDRRPIFVTGFRSPRSGPRTRSAFPPPPSQLSLITLLHGRVAARKMQGHEVTRGTARTNQSRRDTSCSLWSMIFFQRQPGPLPK